MVISFTNIGGDSALRCLACDADIRGKLHHAEVLLRNRLFPSDSENFCRLERLKKNRSRSAARNFGVLARLSEGACPQWPVTERKRSQNAKEPLSVLLNRTATVFLKML
jgi:hypothetical protein